MRGCATAAPGARSGTAATTAAAAPALASRRGLLLSLLAPAAAGVLAGGVVSAAAPPPSLAAVVDLSTLQEEAYLAYAERRFQDAVNLLTQCIGAQPEEARWREMRGEALVDGKNFAAAISDFDTALDLTPGADLVVRARLLSGRALAREGLGEWGAALDDYQSAMEFAGAAGESADPYVLNSIGNCLNSLGRWSEAREAYLASSEVFQGARGFRARNGATTPRLDGAIFAASNAALMRAQMGDEAGALTEMVRISRRAPGSADMRAASAALYWAAGRRQEAEEAWEYACDRITVGCVKYTDLDWLGRIRRWPPAMVGRMADFLQLKGLQ
ncbi:hypothetical protein HXX76_009526 [Chlamydomonas incerta]|uniref:Uncharacterized protein n=1 Tax=Chlamydomonas incerta TaxID=51695 RepID=A0A835SQK9_CHLIN|nr:hypothetical protein HXX76_009526 [Chlamydomonas incerta]|eukprot:KAG2431512.1 hypothetical protein HXX76_009526 [Chlamydomonas incerta]